ncbi:hypothetical protein LZ198_39085 [Myxococcus sp. K15C18031901]|uniref:hypothetical protein n=1 Tax=Myxococcus dinghuensis TaxID=2906761 RepID=UPI0020A835D4|nr:hypothetical protein [Myxococcus dinghuensis]MCP3104888.1 hypothetical protein [Myxococcus dinghuensis]
MQQPKKRPTLTTEAPRTQEPARKVSRPVGMQEMGPGLYEQIRRALLELSLAS